MEKLAYRAQAFIAPYGGEMMGEALKGYFEIFPPPVTEPIMAKYNLSKEMIENETWYSLQIAYDIEAAGCSDSTLGMDYVALGKMAAAEILNIAMITDLETYLMVYLNQITKLALRNVPDELGYIVEKIADKHFHITSNVPSTNDAVYGFMWESCRLLVPEMEDFVVRPIAGYPSHEERVVLEIKWGRQL